MIEASAEFSTDIARLEAMNENIAEQLASLAAERIIALMTELAPEEDRFIRAIRVPRPGPYGDVPATIVEDELVALMKKRPALVGVMFGRYMYDLSDREGETQKAANAAVDAGLLIARRRWDAEFKASSTPSP